MAFVCRVLVGQVLSGSTVCRSPSTFTTWRSAAVAFRQMNQELRETSWESRMIHQFPRNHFPNPSDE